MVGGNESVIYGISNFTIGSGAISYKVDKYSPVTDTLTVKIGSTTIATRSNVTGSSTGELTKSITFSSSELNAIYNAMPKVTKATFTFILSSSEGKTSATATGTLPTALKPVITGMTLSENVSGINAKFGGYVKNKSRLNYSYAITPAVGTTISSYNFTIDGKSYTSKSGVTNVLTSKGTLIYKTYVVDSRGRKSEVFEKSITVLDYESPKLTTFKVIRCNADGVEDTNGSYAKYTIAATISSVNNKNDKSIVIDYKKQQDATWTVWKTSDTYVLKETSAVMPISVDDAYHFRATLTDFFGNVPKVLPISSSFSLMDWLSDGTGISFGKVATDSDTLDIGLEKTFLSENTYMGGNSRSDNEKNLRFNNTGEGTYSHDTKVYGGNGTSPVGIGMWDTANNVPIFQYFDGDDYRFKFGDDIILRWGNYNIEAVLEKVNNSLSGSYKTKEGFLVQWGSINVTASTAGTPERVDVTFPISYSKIPCIMVSISSAVPGTSITGYSHGNDSTTGTSLYVTRNNTTATGTRWLAIGYVE